jgi:glycosyltransferase involved in cell wall biosynthesis
MGNVAESYTKELEKKGCKISVLTPQYPFHDPYPVQGEVTRLKPLFTYGNSAFVPKFYSFLHETDIIHLHYPFFGGAEMVALYKKRYPKKPLVISYHMDTIGSGLLGAFFTFYRKLFFPFIIKQADKVLVASKDYAENSFLAKYNDKVDIVEIPFGVSHHFQEKAADPSAKKPFQLLFVASLDKAHYFKGLHNLLKALSFLANERKNFEKKRDLHLTIVGDGDQKRFYQDLVFDLGLKDLVTFKGKVSDSELANAYKEAHITVLPSIDRSEAFGLVLIESMASGTPVIASNLPGVRSVVDHQKTGLVVHPNDITDLALAIETIVDNPEKYKEMKKASVKKVESQYRWPKITENLIELYKSIV